MTTTTTTNPNDDDNNDNDEVNSQQREQQHPKIRPLIITMGGERQKTLTTIFSSPPYSTHFAPPAFSPGITSRALRNRRGLFLAASAASLLPPAEAAILSPALARDASLSPADVTFLLRDVPISPDRRGSEEDRKLHYATELWRKAKTLNRDRAVLACALAHLVAMKTFVGGDDDDDEGTNDENRYDVILEDGVRLLRDAAECARRVRLATAAAAVAPAHVVYFGWLGSRENIKWVYDTYAPRFAGSATTSAEGSVIPFPLNVEKNEATGSGTPVWGAYAYRISRAGYAALLSELRRDVGALMWRGKRMKCYRAKPIDKVLPRRVGSVCGEGSVVLSLRPCFFRAPMLTSKIHEKWDGAFCESTTVQL
eukprot:CAMPEP_0172511342 /NCGR_PEP_ID=MMETSP1066-20121228/235600_1 /TAXON_ID=671091 /ORGANISM="Coscinodiscus wailesii, Strain CCMP2513" /LENGTH=367 /DNA_ID=CAMNT_0013290663 /DNA_START=187 /DNA_END=1287 /DNA_ORIENTATION=-